MVGCTLDSSSLITIGNVFLTFIDVDGIGGVLSVYFHSFDSYRFGNACWRSQSGTCFVICRGGGVGSGNTVTSMGNAVLLLLCFARRCQILSSWRKSCMFASFFFLPENTQMSDASRAMDSITQSPTVNVGSVIRLKCIAAVSESCSVFDSFKRKMWVW